MDALFQIDEPTSNEDSYNEVEKLTRIFGHESVEQQLLADYNSKTMPCAYMFTGARGIGKAQMAYRFAGFLLVEGQKEKDAEQIGAGLFGDELETKPPISLDIDQNHPSIHRLIADSHSDMLVLELGYDEEKKKQKTEISVSDARRIGKFLSLTAVDGKHKVIIIDPIDALNNNAANAILKWLEEPPENTIFLIIAHAIGGVLPTIRSRCRSINFSTPNITVFRQVIKDKCNLASETDIARLYNISNGSLGTAITLYQSNALDWLDKLYELLTADSAIDVQALYKFTETGSKKKVEALSWENITLICQSILSRIIKSKSSPDDEDIINQISRRQNIDYWLNAWDKVNSQMRYTISLHLDRKTVLVEVITLLSGNRK